MVLSAAMALRQVVHTITPRIPYQYCHGNGYNNLTKTHTCYPIRLKIPYRRSHGDYYNNVRIKRQTYEHSPISIVNRVLPCQPFINVIRTLTGYEVCHMGGHIIFVVRPSAALLVLLFSDTSYGFSLLLYEEC